MSYTVGIDIGATKTIFVLMRNFRVLEVRKVLTPKNREKLILMLKRNIAEFEVGRKIEKIGIGVPGPLNEKRDLILNPPNLKCLWRYSLAKILEKSLKIKTKMDNDVNCFTLGEAIYGAGIGKKIVFGITLGTGVGGGLVLKSKEKMDFFIYWGAFGSAGEVGHLSIKFDGPRCSCGSLGCLEEYCSERFFEKRKMVPQKAAKLAKKGDKKALTLFKEYGQYLGIGLSNVVNLVDPEIIVIGGGIAKAAKFFLPWAQAEMKKRIISPLSKKGVKIKLAKLGELSGAMGATLL